MNWGDKEKVLSVIKLNGVALQYVADKLKDDRDVVMTAIIEEVEECYNFFSKT